MLLAQDFWLDPISGQRHPNQDRLWLIRRGEIARPIFPLDGKRTGTHEWWQADGRHVWYCQWGRGVMRVDVTEEAPQAEVMWPISDRKSAAHAHCSRDGRTIVADIGVDTWDTTGADVTFYNRDTGKCVNIATDLPLLPAEIGGKDRYHIHPHPRFCADDRFIHYTTTVNGRVDVALVAVEELLAATS